MWIYYLEGYEYQVQPRDYLLELGLYFTLLNFPLKISFRNCSQRKILRIWHKMQWILYGIKIHFSHSNGGFSRKWPSFLRGRLLIIWTHSKLLCILLHNGSPYVFLYRVCFGPLVPLHLWILTQRVLCH